MKINHNIDYQKQGLGQKWSFLRRQGHLPRYALHRLRWNLAPRLRRVLDFPDHVDLEATNACQLKCPMCFTRVTGPPTGLMDWDLYQKLVDEIAAAGSFSIRLSWRGESLLHPRIVDMVAYAKRQGLPSVSFLTNGAGLTPAVSENLIRAGLDYIVVSIDGPAGIYETVRRPMTFEKILGHLRGIQQARARLDSPRPLVRVNAVTYFLNGGEREFFEAIGPLADKILLSKTLNFFVQNGPHHPELTCGYPWQRMMVAWDGRVFPCCADVEGDYPLGDANASSLREIWHGRAAEHLRQTMIDRNRLSLRLCRRWDCGLDGWDHDQDPEFIAQMERMLQGETCLTATGTDG
ncbi:MAG: SPASM domain-containing protein [Proteobacteria bacterium]|nr:SPASM domain-containing protein [Pseudomonadota bacterium]